MDILSSINLETGVLLIASLCMLLILYGLQKNDDNFDLRDLIVDSASGKVSLQKFGQLAALILSSWAFVYETRAGRLTEWFFIGYMIAWSGANLASKYIDSKKEDK